MAKNNTEWIINAFESAKVDFTKNLKHPEKYDFTNITSGEDVIKAAKDIEERQTKSRTLRALGRIEPYMKGLEGYAGVIDTFAQAKADILCLIWGPLRLILLMASHLTSAFQKVVEVLQDIGRVLPQFETYTNIFKDNKTIHYGLFLFYRDILDFYATLLNFFAKKNLNIFLNALWPSLRDQLDSIMNRITEDARLITTNASLEHVQATDLLRRNALEEFQKAERFRNDEKFLSLSQALESKACKTFLAANLIRQLQAESTAILYGFIDYNSQAMRRPLRLWHSLIFQLVSYNRDLCSIVHELLITKYDSLTSDNEYVEELFSNLVQSSGPLRIVIDGLDEADETERGAAVDYLLRMTESHPNIKILLCSRPERDLEIKLEQKFHIIRVHQHNEVDINNYVKIEGDAWLSELKECGADDESCNQIRTALEALVKRANGMFLYAKLVLNIAKSAADLSVILDELETLPTGLDGAYWRILLRLKSLQPRLQQNAKRILMWVATAKYPLRESEVLQAVSVKHGKEDFNSTQRTAWIDMRRACGPIIETTHGVVQFVHFTAKRYFFGEQSEQFLALSESEAHVTSTCLTYLAFRSFDSVCSSETSILRRQILAGDFILFQYAATCWLDHVNSCSSMLHSEELKKDKSNLLKVYLTQLFQSRLRNVSEDNDTLPLEPQFVGLAAKAELQQRLMLAHNFFTKLRSSQASHEDDPIMVSGSLMKFRRELDLMHCPDRNHTKDCVCEKLTQLYGDCTFRCDYVTCEYYIRGFSNLVDREQHLSLHRKPFKCPENGCLFTDLGFSSSQDLSRHIKAIHKKITVSSDIPSSVFSSLPPGDIFLILQDAVRDNQVQIAESLLDIAKNGPEFPNNMRILLFVACAQSSRNLLDVLFNAATTITIPDFDLDQALAVAIDAQNFYTTKFLLEQGADVNREATWPDDKELKLLDIPATNQRSQYLRWRCWKMLPINRAFALLHSAILDLLVNSQGANLRLFTGFGYVNTYGMFARFKDDDPEVADRLNQLAWLFADTNLVEAGMQYALENNSLSVLSFCLARGVYFDQPLKITKEVIPCFLSNFSPHSSVAKKKSKILTVILKYCESRGLLPDVCRLGTDERHLVQEAEVHFGMEWEHLVMDAVGKTSY
ncbi:Zinc finger C2H2-type [Fusarium oxysporum f. sp. vasinfectum]|nr:Zinc finger C2H2-type [Fusarium oxysporum f. sp. vasinfectum]